MTRTLLLDRLFQISAVLVCGGCLLLTASLLAASTQTWDPCGVIACWIFLPVPITLGIAQYLALTRPWRRAAQFTARLLGVCTVLVSPLLLVTFYLLLITGSGWSGVAVSLELILFCGGAAWLNERRADNAPNRSAAPKQFSLREVALAVTALAVVLGLTRKYITDLPPRYAENVPRAQAPSLGLPPNASEVTYLLSGHRGPTQFEFTISEADFRAWVKAGIGPPVAITSGTSLREITSPQTVQRCRNPDNPGAIREATIRHGLFYDFRQGDIVVNATYDRTEKRAYFYSCTN